MGTPRPSHATGHGHEADPPVPTPRSRGRPIVPVPKAEHSRSAASADSFSVIPPPGLSDDTGTMSPSTINPYLRDAVLTASPEQLQLMLYDGAIRFASQGRAGIVAKDYEKSYEKFTRAQQIVLEMHKGLNFEVNAELCRRMAALYMFIYNKLVDACVKRETQYVDDALTILRMERETWQLLVDKVSALNQGEEAAAEDAVGTALVVEG